MKAKIKHQVDMIYGFDTSHAPDRISRNAVLAQALLADLTFIYHVCPIASPSTPPSYHHLRQETNIGGTPRHPYRHPAIQKAINMMWFQSKDDDGIVFHEYFTPIPIQAIALVLTVVRSKPHFVVFQSVLTSILCHYQIECCIGEWTDGTYKPSNWKEDHYKTTYLSHIESLTALRDHQPPHGEGLLAQIQYDLLKEARYDFFRM
jgi:Domain of unknown function (DUF6532)